MTNQQAIGAMIRRIRKQQHLSQQQLADKAHVRRATIVDMEAGKGCQLDTLVAVAAALGRKVSLMKNTPDNEQPIS